MNSINNRLRKVWNYISYREIRKRELDRYLQSKTKYQEMSLDEFEMEYIDLKTRYERKKLFISILMITVALSIIMNMWAELYEVAKNVVVLVFEKRTLTSEEAQVALYLWLIIVSLITLVILVMLISTINDTYKIYKNILIMDLVGEERKSV